MPILDLLFPKRCLECGRSGVYVCSNCLGKVTVAKPICFYCRRASIDGATHVRCEKRLGIDGFFSLWMYQGVVRKALIRLKYNFAYDIAKQLSLKFVEQLGDGGKIALNNGLIVSIPIHKKRENWRGFNQMNLIANEVAEKLNLKIVDNLLIRRKVVAPQTTLKGKARRKNIKGVFELNRQLKIENCKLKILLLDDVCTTGSTLKEACKVLRRRGFENVWAVTISRT